MTLSPLVSRFPYLEHVHGWLNPRALAFTALYANHFLAGRQFSSLEIGVHHGKYFIGIENLTPSHQEAFALDVFASQHLNVDGSGRGDLEIFESNLRRFARHRNRVRILQVDSFNCRQQLGAGGRFGLVSIDGGHTRQHTIHDLALAQDLLCPEGLIVLDDILNHEWMGVVDGAVSFFRSVAATRIAPVAIGFNKLFIVHFSHRQAVFDALLQAQAQLREDCLIEVFKSTPFCGFEILSLKPIPKPEPLTP